MISGRLCLCLTRATLKMPSKSVELSLAGWNLPLSRRRNRSPSLRSVACKVAVLEGVFAVLGFWPLLEDFEAPEAEGDEAGREEDIRPIYHMLCFTFTEHRCVELCSFTASSYLQQNAFRAHSFFVARSAMYVHAFSSRVLEPWGVIE